MKEITSDGYTLSKQVPANQDYSVIAIYSDNKGYFEVAQQLKINAPAERVTTTSVSLTPVDYTIIVPDQMYSGGSMNQFKVVFPPEYEYLFDYGIYFYELPWEENGIEYSGNFTLNYSSPSLPKHLGKRLESYDLYYQFVIHLNEDYVDYTPALRAHIPNLDYESKLPTFRVYPKPER